MSRLLNAGEKFRKDKILPSYTVKVRDPHEIPETDSDEEIDLKLKSKL